jgi:hypothetical protein
MLSFVAYWDKDGKRHLVDAYLTGIMDGPCPECGRRNQPVFYRFEDDSGCVGRRYYYCCINCKRHYTDWGGEADRDETEGITLECWQNGDHTEERAAFVNLLRKEWEAWRKFSPPTQKEKEKAKGS